jgi:hypothetical protein
MSSRSRARVALLIIAILFLCFWASKKLGTLDQPEEFADLSEPTPKPTPLDTVSTVKNKDFQAGLKKALKTAELQSTGNEDLTDIEEEVPPEAIDEDAPKSALLLALEDAVSQDPEHAFQKITDALPKLYARKPPEVARALYLLLFLSDQKYEISGWMTREFKKAQTADNGTYRAWQAYPYFLLDTYMQLNQVDVDAMRKLSTTLKTYRVLPRRKSLLRRAREFYVDHPQLFFPNFRRTGSIEKDLK